MDSKRLFAVLVIVFLAIAALIGWSYYGQKKMEQNAVIRDGSNDGPNDGKICAQVITTAQNKDTGEVMEFPNACIPDGWQAIYPAPSPIK